MSNQFDDDFLNDLNDLDSGDAESNQMQDENEVKQENQFVSDHSQLLNNEDFLNHLKNVSKMIDEKIQRKQLNLKDERKEIQKSNKFALQIDRQIDGITKFVREIYENKLPSLRGIVPNSSLFCRTIVDIQQNTQYPDRQKFYYLNSQQRIAVNVSISTPYQNLQSQQKTKVVQAARTVTILQSHHDELMSYLQSCMKTVAPNLCQLVGSYYASKIISAAGGVERLAAMPACNIQVLGGSRSAQIGMSQLERNHTGIFGQMDAVKQAPKKFQMKLVRMFATNTAKCARCDFLGTNPLLGSRLREQMNDRFEKVQEEGGLMRFEKPMEIPDQQPKKKRGGKRHRKMKELYEKSQMRKLQNRIKFNEAEEQIDEGVGLGMLKSGVGKLRVEIKKQKLNNSKKMKQRIQKKSGLQSTLNLAANTGIELINPALIEERKKQLGTDSYFNRQAGFRTIINQKMLKK